LFKNNLIFNLMSYYLIDFSKKSNDFSFDNLIIGKRIKTDQDNSKYYMYYQSDEIETPSEIYIKLPKIRLIYNMGNHKYDKLSIPIYPNWDLTNSFVDWVKKFETDIQECFSESKIKREFVSILAKKNMLNLIKCYINEKPKITSNIDGKTVGLSDFKINGQIELVIKLSYIWSNNTKYGLSSSIYQIKYHGPPEQLDINFIDDEHQSKISKSSSQVISKTISTQNTDLSILKLQKHDLQTPQKTSIKMSLSPKDLLNAIKSLKPVDDNN